MSVVLLALAIVAWLVGALVYAVASRQGAPAWLAFGLGGLTAEIVMALGPLSFP